MQQQLTDTYLKSLTIQEGVALTNNTFGNYPMVDIDWTRLKNQFALVKEEFEELKHAYEQNDTKEIRDGICDVLVTAYGLLHISGVKEEKLQSLWNTRPLWFQMSSDQWMGEITDSVEFVYDDIYDKQLEFDEFLVYLIDEVKNLSLVLGLNIEEDMYQVLVSNLSKVSQTQGDAFITQTYYRESVGVETRLEECSTFPGWIIKVQGNQTGKDGKYYPDGKFLKDRKNFKQPQFN